VSNYYLDTSALVNLYLSDKSDFDSLCSRF